MLWDIFCRVVDNYGDAGVCWRAAADLASRGEGVRLWIDDPAPLAWMAPGGRDGVAVHRWSGEAIDAMPAEVVVEAFGCDPPAGFVARMAAMARPPVWVNLEYLSAESYVERSHALPSPQANGLTKWFFYPGFTERTGGLLREPGLVQRLQAFDASEWLAAKGLAPQAGERVVSLFCYRNDALPTLLDRLADRPTLLLATAGLALAQVEEALGPAMARGALRAMAVPCLTQTDYDHLLWASDLNLMRGEDSFVRAQWAGKPFVWHIYPQDDGAHAAKLAAFLDLCLADAEPALASSVRGIHSWWNGLAHELPPPPPPEAWNAHARAWRDTLLTRQDLISSLLGFISRKR